MNAKSETNPLVAVGVMNHLIERIRERLGADSVITGKGLGRYDAGWNAADLGAGVLVRPASSAEVAEVVRLCAASGVGIVPQGGRTGLVGGSVSDEGQIILSLERMARIERLDRVERVAVVEAGVSLEALQKSAAEQGLEPGIDLAARGTATLGGMASTNAGGVMAFRNGVMRHRVLGLEAVLPSGEIYNDLTRVVKVAAGYDLKHLFIGGEGTLGVITKLAIKLDPLPSATATALFALPSISAVLDTIRLALDIERGHLRAAEAMWRAFWEMNASAQGWRDPSVDMAQPLFLLLSLGGGVETELQTELEDLFSEILDRHPQASGIVARSQRQERELWKLREDTATVYRLYPSAPSFDVSVPLSELESYISRVTNKIVEIRPTLSPFVFGHLADGNLHLIFNHAGPFDAETAARVECALYGDLQAMGGSFSAEHGVGSKRIGALLKTADPVKLSAMRRIKQALDPGGVMNPGKVLPTEFNSRSG